ncbi:tRNA-dependent cyclodipeptide synthase [Candidatus Gracilibacteria bacterium]|nr:tRNA-dependent cyclodipeptide synthase [Candidatus Gracilibacteria bacterium]
MNSSYHIIGMSPGNSYFKEDEVDYLLTTLVSKYGKVAIMIADVPAISTYVAYGYKENRARRDKAIPQGNALKNRVKKSIKKNNYSPDQVYIIDWGQEVENNTSYRSRYNNVKELYQNNSIFRSDVRSTTKQVLVNSGRDISNIESAIDIAIHYLISEIAFLEWAPEYFGVPQVTYVYHKNWGVYENYIAGRYDKHVKSHMDFLLQENPWETYISYWGAEDSEQKKLRVGFTHYPPALIFDKSTGSKSGIFYDLICRLANEHNYQLDWVEYTGYGVVVNALEQQRFDVFSAPLWETRERQGKVSFSKALYKSEVFIWKRKGHLVNDTSRVVVKENDVQHSIAQETYPDHRYVYVPQLSDTDEMLRFVLQGKGEVSFAEQSVFEGLTLREQEVLEKLSPDPIKVYNNSFAFNTKNNELLKIFNDKI